MASFLSKANLLPVAVSIHRWAFPRISKLVYFDLLHFFNNDYFIFVLLVNDLILAIVGADEVTRRHHMAQWQLAMELEDREALWWGSWKRELGWRKSLRLLGHLILELGTTGRRIGQMRSTRWSSGKCSWTRNWGSTKSLLMFCFFPSVLDLRFSSAEIYSCVLIDLSWILACSLFICLNTVVLSDRP